MKANPGGQIDLKAVVGRDGLIQTLWEILAQQSVVLTAERRIGKTTVIKKMEKEPPPGWVPVYQDLEGCHTAAEFAALVYKDVHQFLSLGGKTARRALEVFKHLGGTEIAGMVKLPEAAKASWKDMLISAIEDLMHENESRDRRLLFLWDELPFMLENIRDGESERTAMEVLDVLRALRQKHDGLRMVFTGSIGLHHVITALKDQNYANAPTNDMAKVDVPPLEEEDALKLALALLTGEALPTPDMAAFQGAARAAARAADHFPFYIHHIVRGLKVDGLDASPPSVARVVERRLVDANDPWELLHYRERIPRCYEGDASAVLLLLDELAVKEKATINELLALLKGSMAFDDRERLLRLLTLLERDHYLGRNAADGCFAFRFPLIRRWWKINRGL